MHYYTVLLIKFLNSSNYPIVKGLTDELFTPISEIKFIGSSLDNKLVIIKYIGQLKVRVQGFKFLFSMDPTSFKI